ncbi:MAG: putative ABC transporter permease [[Clostridium] leptum]
MAGIYCSLPPGVLLTAVLTEPLCPVYGFGALLIVFCSRRCSRSRYSLLAGAVVTSLLEYVTGFAGKNLPYKIMGLFQRCFNLHGRVCLKNSLLFGAMGLVRLFASSVRAGPDRQAAMILLVGLAGGSLATFAGFDFQCPHHAPAQREAGGLGALPPICARRGSSRMNA